jgi:hypothetical protein
MRSGTGIWLGAPWPDDLCARCPRADTCRLEAPEDEPTGCNRVEDWRDAMERRAEGER